VQKLNIYEGETTEFKSCCNTARASLPNDSWKTISAFANTRGGDIYLGVADDRTIIGLDSSQLDALQKDLSSMISGDLFNRKPIIKIETMDSYLKVEVKEQEFYNKPIYSKKVGPKKIYIRQGATTVQASEDEMRSLFAGASGGGENQEVACNASVIDESVIDNYISKTGLKRLHLENLESKLKKIKATRGNRLTIFGLVAFGSKESIDQALNNIYIDFRSYSGLNKVENPNEIYRNRKEFHGNIRHQFKQAFKYIKDQLPTENVINRDTGLREKRYVLPEEALREALANALAHRDYLIQSSCVNIELYPDRIEISNPGESLVAIQDLERASSKARNPNLIEFLRTYKITDKSARGILTIYQATRNRGLLKPKFENISSCFRATLFFSSPHTNEDQTWLQRINNNYRLKDTQINALIHAKHNRAISNREYCNINHMNNRSDDRKARRELLDLVNKGLLERIGAGAGTKYQLANPDKEI